MIRKFRQLVWISSGVVNNLSIYVENLMNDLARLSCVNCNPLTVAGSSAYGRCIPPPPTFTLFIDVIIFLTFISMFVFSLICTSITFLQTSSIILSKASLLSMLFII